MSEHPHFSKIIIQQNETIREAMVLFDRNSKGILFVVDEKEKICGVVTDGDIRRGFLKGFQLEDQLSFVMNKEYVAFPQDSDYELIENKFSKKHTHIPILDGDEKIVDYYVFTLDTRIPIAKPSLAGNEAKYLLECVATNWISSQGKFVKRFEKDFAEFLGCTYAVSVCNGTAALHLALETLGIGPGDEVIVPSLTFIATANAVRYTGATAVFVDSEMETWNIDPNKIEEKITKNTKAIIPVHLYGQPAKMSEIMSLAKKYDLHVVEDAAESHGAEYQNQKTGSIGDIGVFSFFGNKIITTGEGGMLVTNNEDIYQKACILRDHGMDPNKRYWYSKIGFNYRMTNMQAAVGCAQMERVENILQKKKHIAQVYRSSLEGFQNIIQPPQNNWSKNICWLYSVVLDGELTQNGIRDQVIQQLYTKGIVCRPMFYPIHQMPPYQDSKYKLDVTDYLSKNGLSFPSYIDLENEEIKNICLQLKKILTTLLFR